MDHADNCDWHVDQYPWECTCNGGKALSSLRRKRLLLLATQPKWHKRFYSQYCVLIQEGSVGWQLGTAYLTVKGQRELLEILTNEQVP